MAGYLQAPGGEVGLRKPKEKTPGKRKRADGRRQILIYLQADVIKGLKLAALDQQKPAYELAESAIREWLLRNKRNR